MISKCVPVKWMRFWGVVLLLGGMMARAGTSQVVLLPGNSGQIGDDLFTHGGVHRITIEISHSDMAVLRRAPRQDVRASVREEGKRYPQVALHLKGATGSFRPVDDKPSFTLDFAHFSSHQRFHGLRKIHLNNSVEDASFLHEYLGAELFRAAGLPAPRVTHALVELNGRRLGLYVLKEGFTEDFLAGYFERVDGAIYDTESADLQILTRAALEPDLDRRWQCLREVLDLDRFVTFLAMEIMLCHRDGYGLAHNNFRIYHDPGTGKMVFLPHGMDQLFRPANLPWAPHMGGDVAKGVLETVEGRQRYRERFVLLFKQVFQVESIIQHVNRLTTRLRPFLRREESKAIHREAANLRERIVARHRFLKWQLNRPMLAPLDFEAGKARLTEWTKVDEPIGGKIDRIQDPNGKTVLHIAAGPQTSASWRTKALLKKGIYRFTGRTKTTAIVPLPYGKNQGAGLRLSGRTERSSALTGDSNWQQLSVDFAVEAATEEVELVCELRASAGECWFELDSLGVALQNTGNVD